MITTNDGNEDNERRTTTMRITTDDGPPSNWFHSHSEREENTPRIASDECPRETRAGGEALAFPVVSPIPSLLSEPSSPYPSLSICVPLSLFPAPRARPLPASFSLQASTLSPSERERAALSVSLRFSPSLVLPFSLPLVLGRRRNPLDVSEPLALFYQPSVVDRPGLRLARPSGRFRRVAAARSASDRSLASTQLDLVPTMTADKDGIGVSDA